MSKFPTFQAVLIALIIGMAWGLINVRSQFTALRAERDALRAQVQQLQAAK